MQYGYELMSIVLIIKEKLGGNYFEITSTMSLHKQACAKVAKHKAHPQIELDYISLYSGGKNTSLHCVN